MYGGGDAACRKISVGESSEEWLMIVQVWMSEVDGESEGDQWWFISDFLDATCRVIMPL